MNYPTKVLRSTFITYETFYHHQQLAKKFYKVASKNLKKNLRTQQRTDEGDKNFSENNPLSYMGELKYCFKEELLKW